MITELASGVYWVGVVDWNLRHFHGYELSTHRGSSYNSYLIVDEKIVLIDTVWGPFRQEFIENIRSLIDPALIDIVVANHAEMDHSGALPDVIKLCPNAKVVVSTRGRDSIPGHYHADWDFQAVKTGDRINIGKRELVFIEAPMLHWPDSMFTYLSGDAILFSNDAFGQHYAAAGRFNDEVDREELYQEAQKYYANILTPFSPQVIKKIDEVLALSLPLKMIAPSHGIIWRSDPTQIVTAYRGWAEQKPDNSAVIIYDSMWHATRHMAEAIGEGLSALDVPYKIFHMPVSDKNDVVAEIFRSRVVICGSPTFNGGVLPGITPILEELRGLKFKNKLGAAFGSFGWSGEAVGKIEERLQEAKFDVPFTGVAAKWQPTDEDLDRCRDLGRALGTRINA